MTDCNIIADISENNITAEIVEQEIVVDQNINEINSDITENKIFAEIKNEEINVTVETLEGDTRFFETLFPRNTKYNSLYSEMTYTSGELTGIIYWDNANKDNLLFTKEFTYTNGKITAVDTTNNKTGSVLTVNVSWNGDDILNITKVLS